jgi:ABC-type branched-subunit amino acid transport system ATPase component
MKLKHVSEYISIKYFNPVEIENFTILTGLNGSGKTHLLKAIKLGNVEIENIDKSEMVYYNYNDFTVHIKEGNQDFNYARKLEESKNERSQVIQKIIKLKQEIINEIRKSQLLPIDNAIYLLLLSTSYLEFTQEFSNHKNYDILKELLRATDYRSSFQSFHTRFTPRFSNFVQNFLNFKGDLQELTPELIEDHFQNAKKNVQEIFEIKHKEYYEFLSSVSDKDIFSLNNNDIESTNFILEDIAEEEKEYQYLKLSNYLNKHYALGGDPDSKYLEHEEFIRAHGNSPIEQINDVLTQYDCNGYFLKTNDFKLQLGEAKSSMKVYINLKQKEKGYVTSFNELSSGEKTLIALSLLIFKSRKKRVIPRVLLLDEIDSSLHPSMITRLLDVIQEIFIKKYGMKVILATHSPTTVALSPNDSIFVLNNNFPDKISKQDKSIAISILSEGFITLNEGLQIIDQLSKMELSVFTEGNNVDYIQRAMELYAPELLSRVDIVDHLKDRTGKNQLNVLYDFFLRMPHANKIIFVFDCDVTTRYEESGVTFYFSFQKNESNDKVNKGIENLFDKNLFDDQFYTTQAKEDGGSHTTLNKNKFSEFIIKHGIKEDFKNFKPLIERIEKLL